MKGRFNGGLGSRGTFMGYHSTRILLAGVSSLGLPLGLGGGEGGLRHACADAL